MISGLDFLKIQLHEAIVQLQQAEKAAERQEILHAAVYVDNAKSILMKVGFRQIAN